MPATSLTASGPDLSTASPRDTLSLTVNTHTRMPEGETGGEEAAGSGGTEEEGAGAAWWRWSQQSFSATGAAVK